MTEKEPKPIIDVEKQTIELAQTPANWVRDAIILSGILAAAAAVISFKVAEHFREKKTSDVVN